MKISEFQTLLKPVTDLVSGMAINSKLAEELNRRFPPEGEAFDRIEKACHQAIADGCVQTAKWGGVGVVLLSPAKRQED